MFGLARKCDAATATVKVGIGEKASTRKVAWELLLALTTARDDLSQIVYMVVGTLGPQTRRR